MFRRRQPRDPATRFFVTACVVVFLLQMLAGPARGPALVGVFGLSEHGLESGAWWQLVTYQFLHGNEVHILVNMLALWFAGRELETVIGTPRFVALYLAGGVIGGLAQVAVAPQSELIGASASVCAVLLAFTTLFPRLPITALLFFVLPVRMRARTLGWILVAASVAFWLSGLQPQVGHIAHLGGFATGLAAGLVLRRRGGGAGADAMPEEPALPRLLTPEDVIAKVQRRGIESLTREELRVLEGWRRTRRWQ